MIEILLVGFALTLVSLLIGFTLGKHQQILPPDMKKQINQIFKRVIPNPQVGPIERPSARDNFYRDNPMAAEEAAEMNKTLDNLNK